MIHLKSLNSREFFNYPPTLFKFLTFNYHFQNFNENSPINSSGGGNIESEYDTASDSGEQGIIEKKSALKEGSRSLSDSGAENSDHSEEDEQDEYEEDEEDNTVN